MSGMACARYWSRRRPAASGAAVKECVLDSSSSSMSRTGMTGAAAGSTPRVARYSGLTVWRRLPLGSMCFDGICENPSRLLDEEERSCDDHTDGNPLDGVKQRAVGVVFELGLAEEGEEELRESAEKECEGSGVLSSAAEMTVRDDSDEECRERDVEGNRVFAEGSAGDVGERPGEVTGQAGITAFGEVAESDERPGE